MDYFASAVMQREVVTVEPSMTLAELERRFLQHRLSGFPVVDRGELVGVVSLSDLLRFLAAQRGSADPLIVEDEADDSQRFSDLHVNETLGPKAESWQVKEIMSTSPIAVQPQARLHEVASLMYRQRIHRIMVVEQGKLQGIITPFDFVRLYSTDRIGAGGRPDRSQDF